MSEKKPVEGSDYTVDDQELLLGVYKRVLWDWLVPRIPRALSPNALTIGGQVLAVLASLAAGLATLGYPILYVVSAILFLVYLTADNVDGPHARRTGRASPLGEFLDHGLDGAASTSLLVAACFMMRVDGALMATLLAIGGLGFSVVFWEQFRTRHLVIPRVSTTEGVTLLAVCLIVVGIMGDPAWMHFKMDAVTPGTILVLVMLVGYAVACVPPIVRVWRAGHSPWELLTVAAVLTTQALFTVLGADGIAPAIGAGLIGGDVTCRIIVLRHRGQAGPILSPFLWLTSVPLALAVALPNVWHPDGWAMVGMGLVIVSYLTMLIRGGRELLARARSSAQAVGT